MRKAARPQLVARRGSGDKTTTEINMTAIREVGCETNRVRPTWKV